MFLWDWGNGRHQGSCPSEIQSQQDWGRAKDPEECHHHSGLWACHRVDGNGGSVSYRGLILRDPGKKRRWCETKARFSEWSPGDRVREAVKHTYASHALGIISLGDLEEPQRVSNPQGRRGN